MALTKREQWIYENCNEKDTPIATIGHWEVPIANTYNKGQVNIGIFAGCLLHAIEFVAKYSEAYPNHGPLDITKVQVYYPEDIPQLTAKAIKQENILNKIKALQAELHSL
jgi:hypothetical protein